LNRLYDANRSRRDASHLQGFVATGYVREISIVRFENAEHPEEPVYSYSRPWGGILLHAQYEGGANAAQKAQARADYA